jgi:hypothetical protein
MTEKPKEPPLSPFAAGFFLVGLLIGLFGLFALSGPIRSFIWEMKVQCLYTEGKCRVLSSRIGRAGDGGGIPALYVTHQVEVDGKTYPPNENTEEFPPTANSVEALAPYQARYADGSVHPCWYDAADPARYSVLVHEGLHPWRTLAYGAIPLPILGLSGLMMWGALRLGQGRGRKGRRRGKGG